MEQVLNIDEIKKLYPDEWVLIGNPIMDDKKLDVLSGIPAYHSKDKRERFVISAETRQILLKLSLLSTQEILSLQEKLQGSSIVFNHELFLQKRT